MELRKTLKIPVTDKTPTRSQALDDKNEAEKKLKIKSERKIELLRKELNKGEKMYSIWR